MRQANVLCIGGSDPSSGAGIQGDVRTVSSLGAHCLTAVTAITFQNTSGYAGTVSLRPATVRRQIESVLDDFDVGAVKLGMVYNSKTISAVAEALSDIKAPIVADPVIRSTTGGTLLKKGAVAKYAKKLFPLAHVITPNLAEAKALSGMDSGERAIASTMARMGARNVVITGVRRDKLVSDYMLSDNKWSSFSSAALDIEVHGSGCAFAAALAVFLARGNSLRGAIERARRHARRVISGAAQVGKGMSSVSALDDLYARLHEAIEQFCEEPGSNNLIPECNTNFVFARESARSHGDILAVDGRITRTLSGPSAGQLRYGASKHVASALLEVRRTFSQVRSAANIAFDEGWLEQMSAAGLSVRSYDRSKEPIEVRERGSSVRWGTRAALEGAQGPPDAISHAGGEGKEPMIVVFGENPKAVLEKIKLVW